MGNESDPNREAAQQRLNIGQDPGGAFPDLRDQYRKQQEEIARSTRSYQSSTYPSSGGSSGSTSQTESKPRSSAKRASNASESSKSSAPSLQGIVALGGFIVGIFLGFKIFGPNVSEYWIAIAILLIGMACAWLAAVSYKLIIGAAILILVFVLLDADKKPVKKESPKALSQSAEHPSKSSTAPSSGDAPLAPNENSEKPAALGKVNTDPSASAQTCAGPWIFKDSRGNEILCVPLQYLVSLETPEKLKDFLDRAAAFEGMGGVPTNGKFHDGSQLLVSRDLLYDQNLAAVIEKTLPELLKEAEYHLEYSKFTGKKRNATYILYRKELGSNSAYGYQLYPGIYTLDEAAAGISERHI